MLNKKCVPVLEDLKNNHIVDSKLCNQCYRIAQEASQNLTEETGRFFAERAIEMAQKCNNIEYLSPKDADYHVQRGNSFLKINYINKP